VFGSLYMGRPGPWGVAHDRLVAWMPPHLGSHCANPSPLSTSPEMHFSTISSRGGAGERVGAPPVRAGAPKVGHACAGGRVSEP
jgi:hypothetical protein